MSYTNWQKLTKRRQFIVDRKFQLDIILRLACCSLFLLVVLSVGLFLPILRDLAFTGSEVAGTDTAAAMLYMHQHFWPVAILCPLLGLLWSVRFSHRIAGPMVRVKSALVQLGQGIVPKPVRTRAGDYMQDEVDCMNRMSASLGMRIRDIHAAEARLATALRACEPHLQSSADQALHQAFAQVMASAKELHETSHAVRLAGQREATEVAAAPAAAPAETPAETAELITG